MANKSSSRWLKWISMLVVVAAVAGGAVWYYKHASDTTPEYQKVAVARGDLTQAVTATGQLNPVTNVTVGSQISGIIIKLNVDFNSVVKSNQIIAEVDPSTYQIGVLKVEAQLANSKANRELARVQANRAKSLHNDKLISDSDYDIANAQLQQAEAQDGKSTRLTSSE